MRAGTFQTSLCCDSSDGFPRLLLNNCRNCCGIFWSNNCWPGTNMSDKTVLSNLAKRLRIVFATGPFATLNCLWKLRLVAVTLCSNLWNFSTKKTRCSIEYNFTHVSLGTRNSFHIAMVERMDCGVQRLTAIDSCTHRSAAFMSESSRNFAYMFFLIWYLHTFRIVFRPVIRVRNGSFNEAIGFGVPFVDIAITAPSVSCFCNYIFKVLYKIFTTFTINIPFVEFFYLRLFTCYLILK